jgi:ABC-type nitrate/sulfonate/bicarbonate transport system substrate-binding protein
MAFVSAFRGCVVCAAIVAMAGTASGQKAREISIGLASTSFATAAPRIAKEMGLYEKRGLTAKFVVMDSANAATTAIISKSIEAAVSGPGEIVVAQGRGQKVVVIANTYGGLGASLVLSKSAADKLGVSPTAPVNARLKALDGLLIAAPSATSSYTVSFRVAAKAAGANVRFTYMAQPAMTAALESGAIQGYIAGAPFWAVPVVRGSGVLWIGGPKGELPAEYAPASTSSLQAMRDVAEANRDVMKRLADVISDLGKAIDERPAEVKAAVARLYPDLDAKTLDVLFASESRAWKAKPLTAKDMAHEIAFVKSNGVQLPQIDSVDPASMLFLVN